MKKNMMFIIILVFIVFITISILNIDITKAEPVTLANTVISKWETNGSPTSWNANASGIFKTNNHEYRYVGANVDNWVRYNDDDYRIIGVFDSNSTGVEGNLVKLIRDKELMTTSWGIYTNNNSVSDSSNWSGEASSEEYESTVSHIPTNAYILLNQYYFNPNSTSIYGTCEDLTYVNNNNYRYTTNDCSKLKRYGIKSTLRDYIEEVTWYLKGFNSVNYSKMDFYNCERGLTTGNTTRDTNCNSGLSGKAAGIVNAKIGLMYVSDYMYASGYYASSNTTSMSTSNYYFANQNWLFNGREWTITPQSVIANFVELYGNVKGSYTYFAYGIRPTFYLKEQVYVTGGDGSFHNPYTIACDTCSE